MPRCTSGNSCIVEQEENQIYLEFNYEDLEYNTDKYETEKAGSRFKFEAENNNRSAEGSIHTWQSSILDDNGIFY